MKMPFQANFLLFIIYLFIYYIFWVEKNKTSEGLKKQSRVEKLIKNVWC